jgi:hypothetical protein
LLRDLQLVRNAHHLLDEPTLQAPLSDSTYAEGILKEKRESGGGFLVSGFWFAVSSFWFRILIQLNPN